MVWCQFDKVEQLKFDPRLREKDGLLYDDFPVFLLSAVKDTKLSPREFLLRCSRSLAKGKLRPPNYPKTISQLATTWIPFWIKDCIVECIADKYDERQFLHVLWQELEISTNKGGKLATGIRQLQVAVEDKFTRRNIPRLAIRRALSAMTSPDAWPNHIRI